MGNYLAKIFLDFMVAFGVVLGACLLAGISAVLTLQPPAFTMKAIAENIKIWAVVVAIGGTIDPFRVIETNILEGRLSPVMEQVLYIFSAFIGAHIGTKLILWICDGGVQS